ncbi:hypothetical protein LOTGIDRAFT_122741 [Lottia gigantea]|uniref:SWIM-type domain-containing protein n=1 Tax=Lottia gigantea TaxID=225164 RepID=V3ZHS2_LOTGI|nr:hypothetical protein LOTGIDRAFT_122741 [Lottia gigantea]ESO90823.1 hypothetical protein LOTGIDRAFT_122741 [Lottia gigantea]
MSASTLAPEKMKSLFGDLGKATMRGVRKCPKCGTFNGTRGVSCKNKTCDAVFKEKERKRGHSAEAVKIITGSTVQVFSVRLRDRGPDYRGFVQLPLVQDLDGNPATVVDTSVIAGAAKCYVDTCVKLCLPEEAVCSHIKSAIECIHEAQPLTLKNSVLNTLQVNNDMKQAIWLLATETTGPLVQRVTKNIMVVKCKPTLKQPMGFLHFSFYEINRNKSDHPEYKFQCSCKTFKNFKHSVVKDDNLRRCVHFYACICAFASDDKLAEEFAYFINLDNNDINTEPQVLNIYPSSEVSVSTTDPCPLEIMVMEEELLGGPSGNTLLTLQEAYDSITNKKSSPAKITKSSHHTPKKPVPTIVDETQVTLGFIQWLSSVTERINQTMHYQFDGNPEPLVFHAPQTFFECLQQRISAGNKKRRLPNFTTGFVRKDALPLGTFTKYTWHITNILHVKQIFDTPEIPLDITRSFIENRDGSYDLYEVPRVEVEPMDDLLKTQSVKNQTPIRPFERKTFLRVGASSVESKDPTPFIIEWIPDILPKSRIGELRIKFEYGHQRNGQVEQRIQVPFQDIPLQTIQTIHVQEL